MQPMQAPAGERAPAPARTCRDTTDLRPRAAEPEASCSGAAAVPRGICAAPSAPAQWLRRRRSVLPGHVIRSAGGRPDIAPAKGAPMKLANLHFALLLL